MAPNSLQHYRRVLLVSAAVAGALTAVPSRGSTQQPAIVGEVQYGGRITALLPANAVQVGGRPHVQYIHQCVWQRAIRVRVESIWDNVAAIYAPDGVTRLAYADDVEGRNAVIDWTCPDNQRYRIAVGAFSPSAVGQFTLTVSAGGTVVVAEQSQPQPQPQPQPPSGPTVQVIQSGSDGFGNLAGRWDMPAGYGQSGTLSDGSGQWQNRPARWYVFRCTQGRTITVAATSTWDNVLYILTRGGQQVAFNDDANGTNAQLTWTCPDGDEYYVGIAMYRAGLGGGQYTITIQ